MGFGHRTESKLYLFSQYINHIDIRVLYSFSLIQKNEYYRQVNQFFHAVNNFFLFSYHDVMCHFDSQT